VEAVLGPGPGLSRPLATHDPAQNEHAERRRLPAGDPPIAGLALTSDLALTSIPSRSDVQIARATVSSFCSPPRTTPSVSARRAIADLALAASTARLARAVDVMGDVGRRDLSRGGKRVDIKVY